MTMLTQLHHFAEVLRRLVAPAPQTLREPANAEEEASRLLAVRWSLTPAAVFLMRPTPL